MEHLEPAGRDDMQRIADTSGADDADDTGSGLDRLPSPGDRRLAVRVTPDALRQIRGGHPWLFDGAIRSLSHPGEAGDLAVVFDDKRRFAAIGLYDPSSPIRVRILHAGDPRRVDDEFWLDRLVTALDRRAELAADGGTTGYRCVHGENDGFPGLVVDRYADTLVVKVYTAAWLPHLRPIVTALLDLLPIERVVLRRGRNVDTRPRPSDRPPQPRSGTTISGASPSGMVPEAGGWAAGGPAGEDPEGAAATVLVGRRPDGPIEFLERGLHFEADVLAGQKTGHFLDQRENRVLVGGLAAGAEVLDVFCCTGGFSVHAAAGGAVSVLGVDRSAHALDSARRNMAHNTDRELVRRCRHGTTEGDAFDVLAALAVDGARFDVVVIDPPSFASRTSQVDRALSAYGRLTELGCSVVRPGGMLVQSSCSSRVGDVAFHHTVREAAAGSGHRLEEWCRTGHAVDHPVGFPEGRYLATLFARVDA